MSDSDFTLASADPRWEHIQFDWHSGLFEIRESFLTNNTGYVWGWEWFGIQDPLDLAIAK